MFFSFLNSISRVMNGFREILDVGLRWVGMLFGLIPKGVGTRLSPLIYRVIHYTFIIAVTLLLAWQSWRFISPGKVEHGSEFVRRYYMGIMFFLFYIFVRLLILAIQFFLARDLSEFEDIDQSFNAGLETLSREGYDIQWLPVFVICGATLDQIKSLFEASHFNWKVNYQSKTLTFLACDEALFISLNDVGATSRQLQVRPSHQVGGTMVSGGAAGSGSGFQATLRPGQIQQAQAAAQTQQVPQSVEPPGATLRPGAIAAMVAGGAGQPGAAGAANTIRPGAGTILPGAIGGRVLTPNKLSRDELRLHQRRLQYFCTRLIRERGAYCPLNGMLQVIPLKWSESTAYEPLLESVKQDLQMMHDSLHLQFPVVVLQSGLEELTGLPAFLERIQEMNPRLRDSRAGSSYPAGLVIDQNSTSWNVEKGLAWFRDWIYDAFAKSLGSPLNRPMYQLLCALFDRRARIARELQLTAGDLTVSKPIRLAGCYFAATGIDKSQQAFVNDVLQRLMQVQNEVAWMPDWRSHDRKLLWLAAIVALLTLVVVAGDGYLVWKIWQQVAQAAE